MAVPGGCFCCRFSTPFLVHQKGLAKRPAPHYAWCSSGTSTQDVVDFDLQARIRAPRWRSRQTRAGPRGNPSASSRNPHRAFALRETAGTGQIAPMAFTTTRFRQESIPCNSRALPPPRRPSPARDLLAGETGSAMTRRRCPLRAVQGDPPQRRGRRLRAGEDHHRDDQGVPRRQRRPGRGQRARARRGREAHRRRRQRADEAQAGRRRDPHRGNPGPGRARADARRRARGRARLRALPRAPLAGARAGKIAEARQARSDRDHRRRQRRVEAARPRAAHRARQGILRGPAPASTPSASSRRR